MNTTTLKVIVIDDDPKFHETYAYYFSTYLEYRLAGIYRSVENALEDYELVKPDIILSEVNFRGLSGIDGLVEIRKKNAQAKVIMVSSNNEFEGIKKAFTYP